MTDNDRAVITAPEKVPAFALARSQWLLPLSFGFAGFLAAFLLFTIEPLAAKTLLPTLGGSAAVWNTAMAFFQFVLLLGYLAAHLTTTWFTGWLRIWVQLAFLVGPAFLLPFAFPSDAAGGSPVAWELSALTIGVGAPFFALATFSPSLQRWFSWTGHSRAHDPFFLYAASNVGSFAGLLAYPFLIELNLDLSEQGSIFRLLYLALIGFAASLLIKIRPVRGERRQIVEEIPWRRRLRWIAWAAAPSLALLAVTRHIATDVASFPLLWVVPLSLYLLTFILAFSARSAVLGRVAERVFSLLAVVALAAASGVLTNLVLGIGIPLAVLMASGLIAHTRLYADRPTVTHLTEFYLWISFGGALGGLLGALVAPAIFNSIVEYPLALIATAALLTGQPDQRRAHWLASIGLFVGLLVIGFVSDDVTLVTVAVGAAGLVAFHLAGRSALFAPLLAVALFVAFSYSDGRVLASERTFYGVHRVLSTDDGIHVMVSGTTIHGLQRFEPVPSDEPLAYYVKAGPFGQLMEITGSDADNIGVIGLGAGALASFLRPNQALTFFEIDPVVVNLAQDPALFTLTSSAEGRVQFVIGDGRLMIRQSKTAFDLIVVDAFTSDAIPTHLVTSDAVESYLQVLNEGGVIGFHISNRHFDLEPILGRIAQHLGLSALATNYQPISSEGSPVSFVVLAREATSLAGFAELPGWKPARVSEDLWTDEFSNLLSVLR